MTAPAEITRQVLTADEVGQLLGMTGGGVRGIARRQGHILGVEPLPDVGGRVMFGARRILAAINGPDGEAATS